MSVGATIGTGCATPVTWLEQAPERSAPTANVNGSRDLRMSDPHIVHQCASHGLDHTSDATVGDTGE